MLLPRTPAPGIALALVLFAAPAYAAQGDGAGILKKEATQVTTAPTPTSSPTDTLSNGQAKTQDTGGGGNSTANAKTPLTKGTTKKLTTTTQQVQTTSSKTTSGTTPLHHTRTRTTTRSSTTRTSSTRHRSGRSPGRTSHRGARAGGWTAGATPLGTGAAAAGNGVPPAPVHKTVKHAVRGSAAAAKSGHETPTTGFARINRAADRVIEVIPGAVMLALAGLSALVLLLIVRSLLIERRRSAALQKSYGVTVQALATAIEAKDHTTGGHIERVRELGLLLARRLAPREARDPQMAYGFLLHDIGKLAIPDSILRAPGRLSEEEWMLMRRHPEEGVRILGSIPFLDRALDVVRHHHERWDGGGYPDGLAGTDIPLWARIFAVVDALDAMTAERPYRHRQPYGVALEEIRRNAAMQFDPEVVEALEALDPAEVERLLEPAQVLDRVAGDVPELEPLEAILAATEAARIEQGDVAAEPPAARVA